MLGEAAHRLLKNSLNNRSCGNSQTLYDQSQYRNVPANNLHHRPRPAGPSGHGRNYNDDPNYYNNGYPNPRGPMPRPRFGFNSPNHFQPNRPNLKPQESYTYQDQYQDLTNGMAGLAMESGVRNRPYPVRMVQPQNPNNQNIGSLPSPPSTWINRPDMTVDGNQQINKTYRIKPRGSQNPESGI